MYDRLRAAAGLVLIALAAGCRVGQPGPVVLERLFPRVPAAAPGETSEAVLKQISAPQNVLDNPPGVTGRVIWNTLYVKFQPTATQAQKQALLDSTSAIVIGGLPIGQDGYYHIALNVRRPTSPDSSSSPLLRARKRLEHDPLVRNVLYDYVDNLMSPDYKRQ